MKKIFVCLAIVLSFFVSILFRAQAGELQDKFIDEDIKFNRISRVFDEENHLTNKFESIGEYDLVVIDDIDYLSVDNLLDLLKTLFDKVGTETKEANNTLSDNGIIELIFSRDSFDYDYTFNFNDGVISVNGIDLLNTKKINLGLVRDGDKGYFPVSLISYIFFSNHLELCRGDEEYDILDKDVMDNELSFGNLNYIKPFSLRWEASSELKKASVLYLLQLFEKYYPNFASKHPNEEELFKTYEDMVAKAKDNASFYKLISNLLRELKDEHSQMVFPGHNFIGDFNEVMGHPEMEKLHNATGQVIEKLDTKIQVREINKKISYLYIPTFSIAYSNFTSELDKIIENHKNKQAIIVDLRGNEGGRAGNTLYLLGSFVKDKFIIYNYNGQKGAIEFQRKPADYFSGKLILLTDKYSYSASNTVAAVFKLNKMGVIIGEKTKGGGYSPECYFLPDNTLIRMSRYAILTDEDGNDFDNGVEPDIEVKNEVVNGKDMILERALQYLKDNSISNKNNE